MLAASVGAMAQTTTPEKTLAPVVVKERAEAPEGKDSVRATETTIGKGKQQLRDIPQSVTVVTERLIDDRNLDTVKEALKNTAGITFLAAEGGAALHCKARATCSSTACATPRFMTATPSTWTASNCCAARHRCCSVGAPPAAL
jgi:outer membrane receptor for monomeric catechols